MIKISLGDKLPSFSLKSTNNETISPSDFKEKILVIAFICNHCPVVKSYENRIIALQDKYKDSVRIIAINSNDDIAFPEDNFSNMVRRVKDRKYNFIYLRDDDQKIAKIFKATYTPEVFVFNKDRRLAYIGAIDDNWKQESQVKEKYLENVINELLQDKEITNNEIQAIGCSIKWK